jgi:DNA-binding XRE family transcriptional regulator
MVIGVCLRKVKTRKKSALQGAIMATTEITKAGKPELQDRAMTMAVAILVERIGSLPKDDKDDLYELFKELPRAETVDELNEIGLSMLEILDQAPVTLHKLNGGEAPAPGPGLQGWINHFGKKIREYREAAGMTQIELANKAGIPQSHVSRLEAGKHSPSHRTLEKLADALGILVRDLDPSAE